ncbi:hypothetical protein VTJ04DRAFT_3224 [Mycothermus thermophilus]|uniref:uncharacterized protein n=1 Tax=Humicola insolens TaxID=85995 RepID=UPI003742E2FF
MLGQSCQSNGTRSALPSSPPPLTTCIGSGRDLDRATAFHACDKLIFEPHFVRRSPIHLGFALLAPICSVLCEYRRPHVIPKPGDNHSDKLDTAHHGTLILSPENPLGIRVCASTCGTSRPNLACVNPQVHPELVRPFSILSYPTP